MEEGAHGDEVQVNPVVGVLFCRHRVLGVSCACFVMFLDAGVLTVWQVDDLFNVLCGMKERRRLRDVKWTDVLLRIHQTLTDDETTYVWIR